MDEETGALLHDLAAGEQFGHRIDVGLDLALMGFQHAQLRLEGAVGHRGDERRDARLQGLDFACAKRGPEHELDSIAGARNLRALHTLIDISEFRKHVTDQEGRNRGVLTELQG